MINTIPLNWQKNSDGLLPAVVQDADTAQVLMLGYMNQDALAQTMTSNLVTFYSRTKKRLWQKGEESGNTLSVVSIVTDCDNDTLLVQVRPSGPTCHKGYTTCFESSNELPIETIGLLIRTISQRAKSNDSASYTKSLVEGGIDACGAKVLEEAEEVVRAAKTEGKQRTIEESCDLLYHLFALIEQQNIDWQSIANEIIKRRH